MLRIAGELVSPRRVRWFGYQGQRAHVSRDSVISSDCTIGVGTRINGPIYVKGSGSLAIGNYCAIGSNVRVITQNHSLSLPATSLWLARKAVGNTALIHAEDVVIDHNVWVGDSVIVLPGVSIGAGAVIGAGSVVTRNVEPYAIAAGNPARVVRSRWQEKFAPLLSDDFWLQSEQEIINTLIRLEGGQ